ncbi:MAG: AsmA family protein [Rhizomicrobium sp.]
MDRRHTEQGYATAPSFAQTHYQRARERLRAARGMHRWSIGEGVRWAVTIVLALIVAAIIAISFLNWNSLRGPIARYVSWKIGRPVHINGDLKVHLWSFTPRVSVDGLVIGNPSWVKTPQMADAQNLTFKIRILPYLFGGRAYLPLLSIDHPNLLVIRQADGTSNWDFNNGEDTGEGMKIPPIQHFAVRNGHIEIHDLKRKITFVGEINSRENTGRGAAFTLDGDGLLNNRKFSAIVRGGPLINVDLSKPYDFYGDIHAGATHVVARGSIKHPFDLGGIEATLTLSGPNLNQLYDLTGLTLPGTPPYRLTGHLIRDEAVYTFQNIDGTVGQSDLHGDLKVDASGDIPFLSGAISSKVLDFADLGPVVGAPPPAKERAQALAAGATAAEVAPMKHLLPDAPLQVDRLRQMNADVTYSAETVRSQDFPLRHASTHVKLQNGILTLDPLSFSFAQGKLAGRAQIDASRSIPVTNIDARLSDIRLEQFVSSKPPAVEGLLVARAKLSGSGNSIQKAANNASGTFTTIIPSGKIRAAFAELTGINVLNGLGLLLSGDKSDTGVRCAVADFSVNRGVMTARNFVFDTDPVLVTGKGAIALDGENMNLELQGHPKKFRLLHLRAPITITGSVNNPQIGVAAGQAIPQGGLAVALGFLSPLAAILPFVDPGLAKDANCTGLIATGKQHGAPVTKKVKAEATHD